MLRAIERVIPRRLDPESAGALEATFELRVRRPAGDDPDRFAIRISHGRCEVRPGSAPDAQAAATFGADDLVRLVSGGVGWPELLSSGRLEMPGDPFLALRFPTLFRLPAARS